MLQLKKPHAAIYLILSDSLTELGSAFVRLQEHYESPSKKFRNRFFSFDEFKKWYCYSQSESGRFSYYQDFGGYNVPGNVVLEFIAKFNGRLRTEEVKLLSLLGWGHKEWPKRFYVIGSPVDSAATIDHEIQHALWTIFPDYQEKMKSLLKSGYDLSGVKEFLKDNMYAVPQYLDECCSYILFDGKMLNRNKVKTTHLHNLRESMLEVYQEYFKNHIKPRGDW